MNTLFDQVWRVAVTAVPLHNQLVKALIRNAYSAVPAFAVPAQPSGSLAAVKRELTDAAGGPSAKRLRTSSIAASRASSPTASSAAGIVRSRMVPRRPSPVVRQLGSGTVALSPHDKSAGGRRATEPPSSVQITCDWRMITVARLPHLRGRCVIACTK